MNRIFGFMLSLGLLSVAWNIVALLLTHSAGTNLYYAAHNLYRMAEGEK